MNAVNYVPILDLRPAEIAALQELPEKDKDMLLPVFKLRPWVSSHNLYNSIERIDEAFGGRSAFLAISDAEPVQKRRAVHDELDRLRDPAVGFGAWCAFFEAPEHRHFIPTLQLTDPVEFDQQASRMWAMGRGLAVVLEEAAMPFGDIIAHRTATLTDSGRDVFFMLDYGRETSAFGRRLDSIKASIDAVLRVAQNSRVVLSATSFPDGFVEIHEQPIYERLVFEELRWEYGARLIFSDRGSGRAVRQLGGAGQPAPRIDLPTADHWYFFREASNDRAAAYQRQAQNAVDSEFWDPKVRVWGTQLIERTAVGDSAAITSPPRAVAARINIHLHHQLHYGNAEGLYDTEEEWTD